MKIQEATDELDIYMRVNYPEFSGTIVWQPVDRSFWLAKLKMRGGMALATFSPGQGLTVFDSVGCLKEAGGLWKKLD